MDDKNLNKSNMAFIEEYFKNGFNATNAYQTVYPKVKRTSAAVLGSKMLRNVKIREAIQEKIEEENAKIELYKWKLMEDTAKKAFGDVTNVAYVENNEVYVKDFDELSEEQKALINGVEQTKSGIKITFVDQLKEKQFLNQLINEKEAKLASLSVTTLDTSILNNLSEGDLLKLIDADEDEDYEGEDEE